MIEEIFEPITNEEIEYAEKLLLPEGQTFDENERRKIIRELKSCCVEACPGSGKTTVLIAKLIILANRMPLKNNKGICVLTHTNVAIEEIKKKLGAKSDVLFKYPNYFGTLQSFIDKYLAIPYYKEKYKKNVEMIDDAYVNAIYSKIKYWGSLHATFKRCKVKASSIKYNFESEEYTFGNVKVNKEYKEYQWLNSRLENNYIRFSEATQLGSIYLEKYPELKKLFSDRFCLVMVDEMQDTKEEDYLILENLFNKEEMSVQYIGDSNQNIFQGVENWAKTPIFTITESKRYGQVLADFLCHIRKNRTEESPSLKGNNNISTHKPHLILFEEEDGVNDKKVINEFIKIIREKNLNQEGEKKPTFKAIGNVGKENEKRTIPVYYKEYLGSNDEEKINFRYLAGKEMKKISKNKEIINLVIKNIIAFFKLNNINNEVRNKSYFYEYLEIKESLIRFKEIIYKYLKNENKEVFSGKLFECLKNVELLNESHRDAFIENFKTPSNAEIIKNNLYEKDGVTVEIATVHSVKGETHTATLYLETYRYSYDIEKISDYIFKKKKPNQQISSKPKQMNVTYVGFSRPTDLLCIAMQNSEKVKELIEKNKKYVEQTYEVRYL
ncbi:MAG: ATP-dependent helicase [Fusobacteriaceae bacterium]|nr:ATP-dependent helicase [Fusobacteriaceae bacterium]